MSDYMAQKADEQIEAGLHERDRMMARIAELDLEIKSLRATNASNRIYMEQIEKEMKRELSFSRDLQSKLDACEAENKSLRDEAAGSDL